ncbi:hypothetical protein Bca52824_039212 [Brassica carinata]|uniref:GRF-type domain-containing protein n=2 Tax=Brassica TaxID=3705 RepID=A0A0D3BI05_BRAOL|nr:PREDICTED: uncharacterized protein At4g04775-like [Brassica oleracea var. oleracea]KAG2292543.1 hypothetical protein Bca52824_039212 [Brassica carinata]
MQGDGSGSSRRRLKSGRKLCLCGLEAAITQAWIEKNPGGRFYGCQRFKEKNGCKFFSWFDEENGTLWQKRALIEARDEIREKSRVIAQLNETIAELRSNLEKIQNEEEIVRKFEEFYV